MHSSLESTCRYRYWLGDVIFINLKCVQMATFHWMILKICRCFTSVQLLKLMMQNINFIFYVLNCEFIFAEVKIRRREVLCQVETSFWNSAQWFDWEVFKKHLPMDRCTLFSATKIFFAQVFRIKFNFLSPTDVWKKFVTQNIKFWYACFFHWNSLGPSKPKCTTIFAFPHWNWRWYYYYFHNQSDQTWLIIEW